MNEHDEIRQIIVEWNQAVMSRDLRKTMALFDDSPEIMLIGSETYEVFKGHQEVEEHMRYIFSKPYRLCWDLKNVSIDQNDKTAWAFVNGSVIITADDSVSAIPYRFILILVKKQTGWKLRLFNGSVPEDAKQ